MPFRVRLVLAPACTAFALFLAGCQGAAPDAAVIQAASLGEYGQARTLVAQNLPSDTGDRKYLLSRMKLGILGLADGLPASCERTFQEIYAVLDTKDVNKDKALASVLLNEDLKIWKGEPFEQALAWNYMALRAGSVSDWDNMRGAADSSLFLLADFGKNEKGERLTTEEIGKKAAAMKERSNNAGGGETDNGGPTAGDKYLTEGYVTEKSNFTLGYLTKGVASQAMIRAEEATAQFDEALKHNAGLAEVVATLKAGRYNTVLFVDYGQGPQKIGYGMDYALAKFVPWEGFASDGRPLNVTLNGEAAMAFPVAHDVNQMAADHMWNNLQDVRKFKSYFGTGAMIAGGALAASGNRNAAFVGLGLLVAGAVAKAGAHADTRYCEVMPQRTYVVPLTISAPDTLIALQVGDDQFTRFMLPAMSPPAPEKVQVRYVRLNSSRVPATWSLSGTIVYCNDRAPAGVADDGLPYILGGHCACAPSPEALSRYQRAGNLTTMSLADLENLYRAEGITWRSEDEPAPARHVLEGGTSLVPPLAGTAGFTRLFCQQHPPYKPKSKELAQFVATLPGRTPTGK